ncbi:MAG: ADP-ribosylglycohydrolase family protein [Cyanosarcina radialis HA8281-LM2]|jgi:ADP-ribosylglycohydrolase|nr:ADP-ribosylglycohydrolase family protein [Cyanosarcina radialis HA8281-LM2]
MRYSLLSRFQGALLGAFLGEIYDSQLSPQSSPTVGVSSKIALLGAESLIRVGKLDIEDWVRNTGIPERSLSTAETAIAIVPMAMFFHENRSLLLQQIKSAAIAWDRTAESVEGVLAVGYAIAKALTEKVQPAALIPQILADFPNSQSEAIEELAQVQELLVQKSSLEMATSKLCRGKKSETAAIAMGFYCFLSTPEDFPLSVRRAIRSSCQPRTTAAIAGTLSGAYNSLSGIPLQWSLTSNQIDPQQIGQIAARLLAVWSGVYDPSRSDRFPSLSVAAPRSK